MVEYYHFKKRLSIVIFINLEIKIIWGTVNSVNKTYVQSEEMEGVPEGCWDYAVFVIGFQDLAFEHSGL